MSTFFRIRQIITYTVTINNGDHGTVAPNGDQEVGAAGLDLTVTPESGYIFNGWNTTGGASMEGNHLTATANGTVTATYREAGSTKIYFYNDKDWATVKVYKWGGSASGTAWPGDNADLETITHDGHKIYSVTVTEGEYENIIFNNGNSGDGNQIGTIPVSEWTAAKPCLRHTSAQGSEWIALPTQNYKIVYGSKIRVTGNPASGSYVDAGTELIFTAATPDAGYTFAGFFSDGGKTQEITGAGVDMENRTYTVTANANIEVHAKYTEILYTVNVSAGEHGSVSPSGELSVGVVGINVTATPATHYYFKDWTTTDGASVASTTAATTKVTATAAGTVTANFKPSWDLRGTFNGWSGTANQFAEYVGDVSTTDVELTAGTNYTFKVHHANGDWYGNSGTMTRSNCTDWTMSTDKDDCTITADITGTYVFTFNASTKKLTVTYPAETTYAVNFAAGANGSVDPEGEQQVGSLTPVAIAATANTHYYFNNWTTEGSAVVANADAASTTVTATAAGTVTANFLPKWDLRGSFNEWGTTNPFVTFDGNDAHVQLDLATGSYTFKIHHKNANNVEGEWYGKQSTEITRDNAEAAKTLEVGSGDTYNITLTADIDGTYTFNFNVDNKNLSITYPALPTYAVNFGVYHSENGTIAATEGGNTISSGYEATQGKTVTFTATPASGFGIEGWYSDSECTNKIDAAGTETTYNVTITEPTTVYVKFRDLGAPMQLRMYNMAGWQNTPKIYIWNASPITTDNSANWASRVDMTNEGNGWWSYTFASGTTSAKYKITNGSSEQNADKIVDSDLSGSAGEVICIEIRQNSPFECSVTRLDNCKPNVEITNIAVSPAIPQAGATITVTPTVTGLAVGSTVYYCWTLKNGDADTGVAFTNNGDGTFSFTAPAVGNYTLHLEVKPGDDCSAEAYAEKDQEFRVYGENFTIYAGTEAGWKDWQGIKAVTASDQDGKANQVQLVREDIGEDSYGRHWYQFTLPISDTNDYLVLYNAVDEWPSTEIGSARTATLDKPAEDACYVVLSEKIAYDNRNVRTDICPAEPVVTITSPAHVIKEGTYAITTKTIMIPGEISYTYTVTDPTGAAVSVNAKGEFVASKVGTYQVSVTATGSGSISATSDVLEVVCEAASLTASVSPIVTSAGATVELTATPTGFSTPDYQWFVKKPGSAAYVEMDGYTEVSGKYVPNQTGSYVFQVKATEDGVTKEATCTLTVSTGTYYVKYADAENNWTWHQMNYMTEDGTYWYKGYYRTDKEFIHVETWKDDSWDAPKYYYNDMTFVGGRDIFTENTDVTYIFNPMTKQVTVIKDNTNSYRIVSTSTKGEFYSNTVVLADATEQKEVSFFFAQDNGNLKLQKFGETGWVDQLLSLSTSAFPSDNVYKAKLDLTNGLTSVKVYSGYYYIFSALGSQNECSNTNKMTAFNNINEEEYYNHYWCVWMDGENNTSATVGNEINHNLANALSSDTQSKMSVRYAYKPENNHFSRAYMRGSQDDKTSFLKVFGENIKAEDGTVLNSLANSQVFMDGSDWVYTTYVKAAAAAYIKLVAHMQGDEYNYLLSASGSKDAKRNIYGVEGDFTDELRFAIIYDFKTNRVISAWSPTGVEEFDHPVTVDADLLVVRNARNNSGITIFTLTGEGQVKLIRKIYTAIELNRDDLFEDGGALKHGLRSRMFQVCVPYDLNIQDITGFVEYGTKINLQAYGGELRAALGWQSYISTFWGNMAYAKSSNIIANRGYVITHNYSRSDFKEITLEGGEKISKMTIYFPSPIKDDGYIIGPVNRYAPTNFHKDNLQCHVSGRENIDSNWQMIGLPGYYPATVESADPEATETGTTNQETNEVEPVTTLHWLYDWNGKYGSYTAYKATEFNLQPTQGYMVQYGGTVTWGAPLAKNGDGETEPIPYPDVVAARAYAPAESASLNGEYCLQLMDNNDKFLDQTFVVLSATSTEEYEPNLDLTKALTDGAPQLFTTAGGYSLAANTLQNTTTEVPVCTSLDDAGEYAFHLKKMTRGSQVPYLYDAQTNTYTNLSTDDYYFSGVAGKEQGRFSIVFGYKAPEIVTSVENVALDSKNGESIEKVMMNGILYILRDGKLYDAMGKTIK